MSYTQHDNGMLTWPTLYKMSSKGKEQQWDIAAIPLKGTGAHRNEPDWATIRVQHGQVDGKIQTASQTIEVGKNRGKSNETTPLQQATSESQAKWLKQLDKGYSQERGGGSMLFKPMLAHKYSDCRQAIIYPVYVQPKLDGVRCIAYFDGVSVNLVSRQGKEHKGLDHIRDALKGLMKAGEAWDGELYVHGMAFQTLISLVKKPQPDSARVQYHVYDVVDGGRPFKDRFENNVFIRVDGFYGQSTGGCVFTVPTWQARSDDEVEKAHREQVALGYEGLMVRVLDCKYTQGYRSRQLLKLKSFLEEDFAIAGVVSGKGKFADQAIFQCRTDAGASFECVPKGTEEQRRQYLADAAKHIGQKLIVRFFEWTSSVPPVPRFPIGVAVRNFD